jgi:hypothetical protein
MPAEFRDRHVLGLQRYMETGEKHIIGRPRPTEVEALRLNGERFPIELTLSVYEIKRRGAIRRHHPRHLLSQRVGT